MLVLCSTCDGKMSKNAEICPHCGENSFNESVVIETYCGKCYGHGQYRVEMSHYSPKWFENNPGREPTTGTFKCDKCNGTGKGDTERIKYIDKRKPA